ncbi:tubulin tyrosine ligase-like 4A isoform X2 [Musca autumnalis]|uniref:tubulin tyrosine ligase-like 4A isoform X2 n=2 Tax=Musca autumnalis TaxID=221902 RepID=UPI003CEFB315
MSSNYHFGNSKNNADDEYEYFVGGIKLCNVKTTLQKMQEDMSMVYEDFNSGIGNLPNSLLKAYQYNREFNQRDILHEQNSYYNLPHQEPPFPNSRQPFNYTIVDKLNNSPHVSCKNGAPPKSVQLHHGNNANNNCQRSLNQRFNEESESHALRHRCRHYDFYCCDSRSEGVYQQYHTCLYNQNTNTPQKTSRRRNLPSTRNMPSSKNILQSNEDLTIDNYELLPDQNNFNENLDEKHRTGQYEKHVLKEKAANNNDDPAYSSWPYDSFNLTAIENVHDFTDSKDIDNHEYKKSKYYIEEKYISSQKSSARKNQEFHQCQRTKDYLNNYERPDDEPLSKEPRDENGKHSPGLLDSPDKCTASHKKTSPQSKNRRVLIYSNQSPRLSHLVSNKRNQRLKTKALVECKLDAVPKIIKACHSADTKSAYSYRSANFSKQTKPTFDCKEFSSEESDSENDLDNISDFEECDDSDISSDSEECYRSHAYKLTHAFDAISSTASVLSSPNSEDSLTNPDSLLVPSLFPNVPPYIAFSSNTKKGPDVPADLYRILKWRVTSVMPRVVRTILSNSGMRLLKKTNDWMGVWGKHMKSPCFKTVRPYQKINHLPGSFKIGRKDSCWKNLVKQMSKHGKKEFGFMPKTYIIPNDLKQLRKSWPKYSQKNVKWIIKPPASARGSGIRVVDRWAQIPKRKSLIVQKYIERPLLINGSKFDLRLYVLVTSIHPLRVYMYHNGLARFASVKYSDKSDTLSDRCMHLTNYSINKFSSNYAKNEDVNACHGHKWTIKSLWNYLASRGVHTELLWDALRSLVLRTILAGENSINNMIRTNVESKYSCFELFGFDVLLDADLIPWLLEVNISPSLHSELPLDAHVKAPLVQSVLNTALYNVPPKLAIERQKEIAAEMSLQPGPICHDKRLYINYLSRTEKIKHSTFTRKTIEDRNEYLDAILENLTPDDVRCLIVAEDELARSSPLERIFPTSETHKYLKYTETPRYYNRLLDAWETRYSYNRIEGINLLRQYCEEKYHLQVPQIPTKKDFFVKFLRWILKS